MRLAQLGIVTASTMILGSGAAWASDWVSFTNETAARMVGAASLTTTDGEEKDFAWADLNQDGWIDLVSVRKQPFTSPGKRVNVLFMNENGVLTDRSALYASATDVPGDQGFLTPTNDRDVVIADLDLDGWLDVITATTLSDGSTKEIGHPRVYRNLGNDLDGNWLGLKFENFRIPQLESINGINQNPRFCSVAVGDVTGDGYPDLYFGDYDSGGSIGNESGGDNYDMDNRLLVNKGLEDPGVFVDESLVAVDGIPGNFRFGPTPFTGVNGHLNSAFGAASIIADMNNDGKNDIVKQTALQTPQHVAISYNNTATEGFFGSYDNVYSGQSPYFVTEGDLNNDGKLDLVVADDFTDRYLLQGALGADTLPNFTQMNLPGAGGAGGTGGFGAQVVIADLNLDGFKDVLISDVDVDIAPCPTGRFADIVRNNANPPNVTFAQDYGNIPAAIMNGVHNIAVFDINNDCWPDIVLGKCPGYAVFINNPPPGEACEPKDPCPADFNGDGGVDGADLGSLLLVFGSTDEAADLNGDGIVDGADLGALLLAFGACP